MSKRFSVLLLLLTAASPALATSVEQMALLPSGTYTPLYLEKERPDRLEKQPVSVEAFWLDRVSVTNRQFLEFVARHPEWKRSAVKGIFADSNYLQQLSDDAVLKDGSDVDSPVVNVSWFAAAAYCEAQGARLPTTDEWEYALADNGRGNEIVQQRVLDWYAIPNQGLPTAGSQPVNGFGIRDLAGVIWEWTLDFNSFMAPSDSRDSGQKDSFCGSGSLNASSTRDYAAFMRYSYRGSLQGAFTGKNLGFRCAKDAR